MKNYKLLFLIFTIPFFACNTDSRTETEKKLIGDWESLSIKVEINSEGGESRVLEVPRSQWEEKLKIQPIQTTYNADSTYSSVYKSLEGKVITTNKGTWLIKNDALIMRETEPRKENFRYSVEFSGDSALFKGEIDWDLDGKKDDFYEGWQIKVESESK
ncbi:MAG: hypothetical protein WD048_09875 [Chitinophagales bacterium]